MAKTPSVRPYFKTPRRLRKTPLLTVRELAEKTPSRIRRNVKNVAIRDVRVGKTPKLLDGYVTYRVDTINMENKHRYIITVFCPTPRVKADSKVIIDSPVPLYVFTYEYSNARRGNGFIYRTNGEPPVQKNPRNLPGLDHHAYAALRYLINKTRDIARQRREQARAEARRNRS